MCGVGWIGECFRLAATADGDWCTFFAFVYSVIACDLLDYGNMHSSGSCPLSLRLVVAPPALCPGLVERTKEMSKETQRKGPKESLPYSPSA
jgi:hypothetical protein